MLSARFRQRFSHTKLLADATLPWVESARGKLIHLRRNETMMEANIDAAQKLSARNGRRELSLKYLPRNENARGG